MAVEGALAARCPAEAVGRAGPYEQGSRLRWTPHCTSSLPGSVPSVGYTGLDLDETICGRSGASSSRVLVLGFDAGSAM